LGSLANDELVGVNGEKCVSYSLVHLEASTLGGKEKRRRGEGGGGEEKGKGREEKTYGVNIGITSVSPGADGKGLIADIVSNNL
jgi:hypothetical protein